MPNEPDSIPSLADFEQRSPADVSPLVEGKTVAFAPGGTSRWYFLEHGDPSQGYARGDQFADYAHRSLRRIVEIVDMMCSDGIGAVFVVAHMPGQDTRDKAYNENLRWVYRLFTDDHARELYDHSNLGILFRGGWAEAFSRLGAADVLADCEALERETVHRARWLIWLTSDELIPRAVVPILKESLERDGCLPDRASLAAAYYGRPLDHVDIFLSNNKLSVKDMAPPLLTLGDLYFTVSPSFYMTRQGWRQVLYDHLFARRGHYRDYTAIPQEALAEMRGFYHANQDVIMGVGGYHAPSQTWRPTLPVTIKDQPPGE